MPTLTLDQIATQGYVDQGLSYELASAIVSGNVDPAVQEAMTYSYNRGYGQGVATCATEEVEATDNDSLIPKTIVNAECAKRRMTKFLRYSLIPGAGPILARNYAKNNPLDGSDCEPTWYEKDRFNIPWIGAGVAAFTFAALRQQDRDFAVQVGGALAAGFISDYAAGTAAAQLAKIPILGWFWR